MIATMTEFTYKKKVISNFIQKKKLFLFMGNKQPNVDQKKKKE